MTYLALGLLLPAFWFGFWWLIFPIALAVGYAMGEKRSGIAFALGAGLVWASLAFVRDGETAGVISRRLAGMFSLPGSVAFFVLVFVIGFLSAWFWFAAGRQIQVLLNR